MATVRIPDGGDPNFALNRCRVLIGLRPILKPGVRVDLSRYYERSIDMDGLRREGVIE